MSASERFPIPNHRFRFETNRREPACAEALDKLSAQPSPPGDVLEGSGELVGGFPGPPSLRAQARHARWLKTLDRHQAERKRLFKELRERRNSQLFYQAWNEHVPAHEIRPLGAALAKRLAASRQAFAPRSATGDLELGIAFLHLLAANMDAFLRLWLDEPRTRDVRLLKREYWKIAGNPPSAAWVKGAQTQDRHRRRQRAMMAKRPARYLEGRHAFPPDQFAQALSALKAGTTPVWDDIEETLADPFDLHEEAETGEELQNLRALLQDFRTTLAPKEQIAFDRMLNDEPPADNAEACARYRVGNKLRDFYMEAQKGTEDMNAAVANDLADLKLGQRMQGETLDEILRGVEALRARDLEVIDDEDQESAA